MKDIIWSKQSQRMCLNLQSLSLGLREFLSIVLISPRIMGPIVVYDYRFVLYNNRTTAEPRLENRAKKCPSYWLRTAMNWLIWLQIERGHWNTAVYELANHGQQIVKWKCQIHSTKQLVHFTFSLLLPFQILILLGLLYISLALHSEYVPKKAYKTLAWVAAIWGRNTLNENSCYSDENVN